MMDFLTLVVATAAIIGLKFLTGLVLKKRKRLSTANKSVFITGCDSGIGSMFAKRLDKIGFTVFAGCFLPDEDGAKRLQKETSNRLTVVPLNITNDESVKNAVQIVTENLPPGQKGLYGLINNAGVLVMGEFDWQTMRQVETQVNTNLLGTMRVTKQFLDLITVTPGRIVNVTSINGRFAYPEVGVYCATKYGLEGFSDALRYELKKENVKVSIIEPGDFSKVTNIMKPFQANLKLMLENMNGTKKQKHEQAIKKKMEKLAARDAQFKPDPAKAQKLFSIICDDVEDALLAESPQIRYVSAPRSFRIAFWFLTKLPVEIMDKLLEKAVKRMRR